MFACHPRFPFIPYPLLCWPCTAGTSYFSLCWCNNLKSHNKATYCWHRDRAAWLLLLRFPLPFFLLSLSFSPCLLRLCLTITIFLWIWIWLLARIDCKTSLQPSPQMCSSSQVHTSLLTLPSIVLYHLLLPAVSPYIYFSYFSLQRARKTELRLNSSRHFFLFLNFLFYLVDARWRVA